MSATILSLMMSLVMIFNMGAGALTQLDKPAYFDVQANVNADSIGMLAPELFEDETQAPVIRAVIDLLNNVAFEFRADTKSFEAAVKTDDTLLADIGVRNAEDGLSVASSLVKGHVLNISPETVAKAKGDTGETQTISDIVAQMKTLDKAQMMNDFTAMIDSAVNAVKEKAGEAETGDFWINEEFAFTTKAAVNMDDKEFITLVAGALKEYLSKDYFQKYFEMTGSNPAEALDSTLSEIQNRPEDQAVETAVVLYGNAEGESYVLADMHQAANDSRPEVRLALGFGTEFHCHRVRVNYEPDNAVPSYVSMNLISDTQWDMAADLADGSSGTELFLNLIETEDKPVDGVVGITMPGMFVRAILDAIKDGERTGYHARVLYTPQGEDVENADDIELGTFDVSWGEGAVMTSVYDGEGVRKLSIERLNARVDEEEKALTDVMSQVLNGAIMSLNVLVKKMSPESSKVINQWIMTLIQTAQTAPLIIHEKSN